MRLVLREVGGPIALTALTTFIGFSGLLLANHVGQAMQQLEEPQRRVLYMSYYEGYSHSEIAQRLDLPVGTVKSRIRSGVNRLRGLLEEEV